MLPPSAKGFLPAAAAGFCRGSMGAAVQAMMAESTLTPLDSVCLRTVGAGLLLMLLTLFAERAGLKALLSDRRLLFDTALCGVPVFVLFRGSPSEQGGEGRRLSENPDRDFK